MEDFTRVFSRISEKIARVLDVFDFSYIISGATACVMIYLYFLFTDNQDILSKLNTIAWYVVILIAYIIGLIMFAMGRVIRQELFGDKKKKYEFFKNAGIEKSELELDALFCKYWDNLQNNENGNEYAYYRRLWVMTAVYEGLIGDLLLAAILSIKPIYDMCTSSEGLCCAILKLILIVIAFGLVFYILLRETRKYADTVVNDLIFKNNNYLRKED